MSAPEFLEQVVRPNLAEMASDYSVGMRKGYAKAFNAIHAQDALAAHIYDIAGRQLVEVRSEKALQKKRIWRCD